MCKLCVSVDNEIELLCHFIKRYMLLIFSYNLRFWSASITSLTEREFFRFNSIRNLRQIGISQRTVNANELGTKALRGSC